MITEAEGTNAENASSSTATNATWFEGKIVSYYTNAIRYTNAI